MLSAEQLTSFYQRRIGDLLRESHCDKANGALVQGQ